MMSIQVSADVVSTEAFEALAGVSDVLAAYPNEPVCNDELLKRYSHAHEGQLDFRPRVQSTRTILSFVEQFEQFRRAEQIKNGSLIGSTVFGDGSLVQVFLFDTVDYGDIDYPSKTKEITAYLKANAEKEVDDLALLVGFHNGFMGKRVTENVFTGYGNRPDDPSKLYLSRQAGRTAHRPMGASYSTRFFDFIAEIPIPARV